MKILLRSCFTVEPTEDKESFTANYHSLRASGLGFLTPQDEVIWKYIRDFVGEQIHVPDIASLHLHFTRIKEDEIIDRLGELRKLQPLVGGDFKHRVEDKVNQRKVKTATEILKESATIISTGVEIQGRRRNEKRVLRGPEDAIRYVMDRGHEVITPSTGVKLSGDVIADTHDFREEYKRIKENPLYGIGAFCGIEQLDESMYGAKPQELWLHAAFTGGLKSTLALTWAYTQAIYYRNNVLFFSLEMPYQQCRRLLVTMHSALSKFKDVHPPLKYDDVKRGKLSADEEQFLNHLLDDMEQGKQTGEYGAIQIEVADPDQSDFTITDLRSRAELLHSQTPYSLLIVDHVGLMQARGRHSSTTERLNEVLRDLKRMAMSFHKGSGIAVLGLFQISREGYKAAEKNEGRFNLTHLSYANEAERSSDIVTTTWVDDDLRSRSQVRFQCLKSRDQKPFDPFNASVQWDCRRIRTLRESGLNYIESGDEIENLMDSW